MTFTAEEIDRMSPECREEIQCLILARHEAAKQVHVPERRRSRKPPRGNGWAKPWHVHNDPIEAKLRATRAVILA